jgi:hypothetical protein
MEGIVLCWAQKYAVVFAEEDGRERDRELVDENGAEVRGYDARTAGDADVFVSRGIARHAEGVLDAVAHEVKEGGAALAHPWASRVAAEDEDRRVEGRIFGPVDSPSSNMRLPKMLAPMRWRRVSMTRLSGPVSPPSPRPRFRRNACCGNAQSWRVTPPSPSGFRGVLGWGRR